jgi:hypothetical protein
MTDDTRCDCGARHAPDAPCASPMGAVRGCWPMTPCTRCGQLSDTAGPCATCRASAREPQGETVRLFEPAPAQLEGQAFWALEVEPLPARIL